ncbi:hypothetical protein T440DRAFT_477553 [Plenodomus tracheiphilus IPT5]|uniref:Uncharacterized protein n=1 Tax=Plenodomus tracheiphilus IPT5 TaxID=1408161 RepID=A0A6A7BBJ5_9PLEO|nr:hypothetical protein T440DRAFT_477553 [Plenodomus tracheiphilus IPT5]
MYSMHTVTVLVWCGTRLGAIARARRAEGELRGIMAGCVQYPLCQSGCTARRWCKVSTSESGVPDSVDAPLCFKVCEDARPRAATQRRCPPGHAEHAEQTAPELRPQAHVCCGASTTTLPRPLSTRTQPARRRAAVVSESLHSTVLVTCNAPAPVAPNQAPSAAGLPTTTSPIYLLTSCSTAPSSAHPSHARSSTAAAASPVPP